MAVPATGQVHPYNFAMAKSWKTRLIHSDAKVPEGYRSLASPVFRGSTTLFTDAASVNDRWDQYEVGYTYGLYGTPTTFELAGKICELEKGYRTIVTPGGQGAISLINLALLKTSDHILIPESVYTPNQQLARECVAAIRSGTQFLSAEIGAGIKDFSAKEHAAGLVRESGIDHHGSGGRAGHRRPRMLAEVLVALDNTWSAGVYFDAFAHGVDITMQALTKYVGGHSDVLLGSVTVKDPKLYQQLGVTQQLLGSAASPDDCSLALRGMRTMAVRLKHIEASALCRSRAGWRRVRRLSACCIPRSESSPGHEIWKRDFTGSAGVFSIVFKPELRKTKSCVCGWAGVVRNRL